METAIEAVADEVATNLEEVAAVTRGISGKGVVIFIGGAVIGAAAGFYFGYRYNREKIRAEEFARSEEEISQIREDYARRVVAHEPKPTIDEVLEREGYSPSGSVVDEVERTRPLKPPVPVGEPGYIVREPRPSASVNIPPVTTSSANDRKWDFAKELEARTTEEPYVIHQDEVNESDYRGVQYTYYAGDDVLVDEDDKVLLHPDIVVGPNNLKFGHGSDDENVVYVRNDKLEVDMEITRVPTKFEEEVLGIHDESDN